MTRQSSAEKKGADMTKNNAVTADTDMDRVENVKERAYIYAEQLAIQLRKGFLAYCVLRVCSHEPRYTSDIIARLREAEMMVVEGTIYPLLNRLQKDGLLEHQWQESEQGPPRKYYRTTTFGEVVEKNVAGNIKTLNQTITKL